MDIYLEYFNILFAAIKPYWAELVGAFLMATMANLMSAKGAQKESSSFLSAAFYTIIIKDVVMVLLKVVPIIYPSVVFTTEIPFYTHIAFVSLVSAFFIASALKNLRLYFSPIIMVVMLTLVLSSFGVILPRYERFYGVATYLPSVYLTLSLFVAGIAFYLNKTTRQNKAMRAVGNGLIVLSVCYSYQLFDLVENFQLVLLLCYTVAMVLSLGSQVQFLNLYTMKLEKQIETDKKAKREIWEFSPFPVVISRLRDDEMLYMNPAACEMLSLDKNEYQNYPLSAYFIDPEKKNELLDNIRLNQVVRSFEVQVHHPKKNNNLWIDMTTRTTDMDEEIVLFTTFKDITEQKKAAKVLEEQASTDPLTGLYNRRQFEILTYQGLQTAKRYNMPYSLLMLDIDFFKKINDTYGHDAGDEVLKNLARVLKETVRKSDVVARHGGEEFIVFLPQTAPEEALIAAEHIRKAVENMETRTEEHTIPVTVSIGVSDCQTFNLNTLIKQADEALYDSKNKGRNRTTLYQDLINRKMGITDPNKEQEETKEEGKES